MAFTWGQRRRREGCRGRNGGIDGSCNGARHGRDRTGWQASKSALFESKYMIMNGDRKTHKNTESFNSLSQDRDLSLEEKSVQADIILDVFDHTLFLPGDWHTGMNMVQAISNIYWHVLLKHMKS